MTRLALCLGASLVLAGVVGAAGARTDVVGLWEMTGFEGPGPDGECCIALRADQVFSMVCRDPNQRDLEIAPMTGTYRIDGDTIVATRDEVTLPPIRFVVDAGTLELQFPLDADQIARVRFERRPWAPAWCSRSLDGDGTRP